MIKKRNTENRPLCFADDVLPVTPNSTVTFSYEDSNWSDLLTSYNGNALTYDALGNMLTYNGYTYTWEAGRRLTQMTNGTNTYSYKYDDNGIRTQKTINGVTTYYTTVDGRITGQYDSVNTIYFRYNADNSLIGFNLNGTEYIYLKNIQGDIEGILDLNGNLVVEYTYDAWGKVLSITGSMADTLGTINPMRYRDYYLDSETGYYYLQSRYYNPEFCRFINADEPNLILQALKTENKLNLFAYCNNNPIMYVDVDGHELVSFAIVAGYLILAVVVSYVFIYSWYALDMNNKLSQLFWQVGYAIKTGINALTAAINTAVSKAKTAKKTWKTEIHHIVAQSAWQAALSRVFLKNVGIGINSNTNKVEINYNLHRRLHTNAYYTAVNIIITTAYGKGKTYWVRRAYVITALDSIKKILIVANLGL